MEQIRSKRRLPSLLRWILWVLLVQFVLINISSALYAWKFTHFYEDSEIRKPSSNQNIFVKTWRLFTGPRFEKSVITESPTFPYDTVTLKTEKGIFIDAWYSKADSAKGTVLIFHGISSNKAFLITEANEFRFQGYNIMMVDFRAHGNSGGNTTTMGIRETEEVKLAYDYVVQQGEKNIFLYGSSMGAVVVMKAIADYQLNSSGVILEMPFASMQTHLQARARLLGFSGFTEKPFGFLVTGWAGLERGFNGYAHRTSKYAAKLSCPVLMQWGALDNIVLKKETDRIFNAIASTNKKLVIYDQAGHGSLLQNNPVKWQAEVEQFLSVNKR
jgi:uncharacterized protein